VSSQTFVIVGAGLATAAATLSMAFSVIVGAPAAGVSLMVQFRHHRRVLRRHDGMVVDEFAIAVPTHIIGKEGMHGPRL
jgi:hypothetical protein